MIDEIHSAARAVITERQRQVWVEGFTPKHDDKYKKGELELAAVAYALAAIGFTARQYWPWDHKWFKPHDVKRRLLVKAGALILAAIERLDRENCECNNELYQDRG